MSNNTLTLTLSSKTRERLQQEAEKDPGYISLERHINGILARHVERPTWSDVSEIAALAAEVETLRRQLESARGWAAWWTGVAGAEVARREQAEAITGAHILTTERRVQQP